MLLQTSATRDIEKASTGLNLTIPCVAHRPPHRKKRNTVTVNAKIIVTASKKALGNKAQGAAKTIGKRDPGTR